MTRGLRTQLTLLYAVPFLVSGALLVSIPLLQSRNSAPVGSPLGQPPDPNPNEARVLLASALGLAAMGLLALLLGWLVAGRYLRPLRRITATARDISASNLHRRLGHTGPPNEFAELAATLDDLFTRLEASFASQRDFVANASHELRTPLTAERALLQVALADPDLTMTGLRTICQEVLTLGAAQERLVDALLTLATSEQGIEHPEPFDLAAVTAEVVQTRAPTARSSLAPAAGTGDPRLIESLVTNLIDNAVRHNKPGGTVEVTTATIDGRAVLTVSNTGPVIPPEELDRLFQPFQRLAAPRQSHPRGHGLGLAIVQAIATAHHATLTGQALPQGGLTLQVLFPVRRQQMHG